MKVTQLAAKNYKRLRYVEIRPAGELVVIGGRNAQGKTSILDALADALAGSKTKALEPVRHGEDRADIVVKTDTGLTIRKYYTAGGGYGLRVQTDDGAEFPSAAAYLAKFFNSLTFDPLEFARASEDKQAATLRKLAGIDTEGLDLQRKVVFDERTIVNRRVRDLKGELDGIGPRPLTDGKSWNIDELLAKQREATEEQARQTGLRRDLVTAEDRVAGCDRECERQQEELARVTEMLRVAKLRREEAIALYAKVRETVEALLPPNDFSATIAEATKHNDANANVKRWDLANERHEQAVYQSQLLTDQIDEIDLEKLEAIRSATYPLPELSVDAAGHVLYAGIPFSQASAAEQVKVSAACGLALKPELRLLIIRDGSLLDDDSMASLEALAIEHDAQIFIEKVGAEGASVVIEDGEVVA